MGKEKAMTAKVQALELERWFGVGDRAVNALGPLDLTIEDGEFVCVVGPSGCGKSTLLRIIAGLVRPSAGRLDLQHRERSRALTAMVFQDYSIFPWKSVESNVAFGLDMAGVKKQVSAPRVDRWLRKLGLSDFKKAYPHTLSGGMRQRVSIARALAVEPEVLLMDEPFAALDAQLRTILQDELLTLWQEDRRTVIFITHSIEEAILLGDRVIVMSARPGRVVADIRVPFERPRATEIRGSGEFAHLEQEIWEILRVEVNRVLAATNAAQREEGAA